MESYTPLVKSVYKFILEKYPSKRFLPPLKSINKITDIMGLQLSHMDIRLFDYTLCLFNKGVTKVRLQSNEYTLKEYQELLAPYINCIELILFVKYPYYVPFSKFPPLQVHQVCVNGHWTTPMFKQLPIEKVIVHSDPNHFYFQDFTIAINAQQLSNEINRLLEIRDKYPVLHFHLENNRGGDLIPVHVLIRCLCGKGKESWMTPYVIEDSVWGTSKDDRWNPWETDSSQHTQYKQLKLKKFHLFDDKYKGRIVLHTNTQNASATWFFITYLIYAFSTSIQRKIFTVKGIPIKVGRVKGLQIHGYSSTTSGDGNAEFRIDYFDGSPLLVRAPTQQFIKSPIVGDDYNRFWLPT